MRNNYVFSEEDRSWPGIVFGIALMQMMLLISGWLVSFPGRRNPSLNHKFILILCGAAAAVYFLALFLVVLKDDRIRSVKYELFDGSVCFRMGRTTRNLNASDNVRVSIRMITTGYKTAPIRKKYYVLSKGGTEVPQNIGNPFRWLRQFDFLLLPYSEQVRQKLADVFGNIEILDQVVDHKNETGYVLSGDERVKHYFAIGILQMLPVVLLTVLINARVKTDTTFIVFFCSLIYLSVQNAFLYSSKYGSQSNPYPFLRYQFSDDTVCMYLGDEKRCIHATDLFQISYKTILFAQRYGPSERKYIVLWKNSESEPKDQVGVIELLSQADLIVLPSTIEVRDQLQKVFGVT